MEINLDLIIYFSSAAYKVGGAGHRTIECVYICIEPVLGLALGSEMQH